MFCLWAVLQQPPSLTDMRHLLFGQIHSSAGNHHDIIRGLVWLQAAATVPTDAAGKVSTKSISPGSPVSYQSTWEVYPVPLKNVALSGQPMITWDDFRNTSSNSTTFVVSSKAVAAFVALESTLPGK